MAAIPFGRWLPVLPLCPELFHFQFNYYWAKDDFDWSGRGSVSYTKTKFDSPWTTRAVKWPQYRKCWWFFRVRVIWWRRAFGRDILSCSGYFPSWTSRYVNLRNNSSKGQKESTTVWFTGLFVAVLFNFVLGSELNRAYHVITESSGWNLINEGWKEYIPS